MMVRDMVKVWRLFIVGMVAYIWSEHQVRSSLLQRVKPPHLLKIHTDVTLSGLKGQLDQIKRQLNYRAHGGWIVLSINFIDRLSLKCVVKKDEAHERWRRENYALDLWSIQY